MFDEMPVDQFYQFLAARATVPHHPTSAAAAANCLSFSLHHHHHHHGPALVDPSSYSHYSPSPPQQGFISPPPPIPHLLNQPPLHLQLKNEDKEEAGLTSELDLVHHSWSNDEVLALLRIRSSLDNNWFPDFIWENVSRKLGDLGFKRSAENCKQKFEEETRSFNTTINANNNNNNANNNNNNNNCTTKNNNISNIQNYRLFGELEDLYNNHHPPPHHDDQQQCAAQSDHDQSPSRQVDDDIDEEEDKQGGVGENSVDMSEKTEENRKRVIRKRKRKNKFEMFKGYCENIVNKMMAQQEDLHCKILQDMISRDEEKIAREEAWKKKEFERIQMEMQVRAHELAIAGDRQAKILSLLNNFTSSSTSFSLEPQALIEAIDNLLKLQKYTSSSTTSSPDLTQDSIISAQPTSSCSTHDQNPSFFTPNVIEISKLGISQNPNENNVFKFPSIPIDKSLGSTDHTSTETTDHSSIENSTKDDIGRRWPRDEVLALINIRCSHESKDNQISSIITKGIPLWERISKRMMEMGFKRNARRCKEKWENINKYFRKTKDLNKKRSIDSRTCPYFHQLSHLYSQTQGQGTLLLGTSDPQVVSQLPPGSPENRPTVAQEGSTVVHGSQGDNQGSSVVQAPSSLDFEF